MAPQNACGHSGCPRSTPVGTTHPCPCPQDTHLDSRVLQTLLPKAPVSCQPVLSALGPTLGSSTVTRKEDSIFHLNLNQMWSGVKEKEKPNQKCPQVVLRACPVCYLNLFDISVFP